MYKYGERSGSQIFYEWLGLGEKWITSEQSFDTDFPSKPQDPGTSLAAHIVETVFNLPLDHGSRQYGGYLAGYDVQNRDPYQIIQLSLAEELSNNRFMECYADENGTVKFYEVGTGRSVSSTDIFYSITTTTLRQKCDSVIVEGYDPPAKKFVRAPHNLFTFANSQFIKHRTPDDLRYDPLLNQYPLLYSLGEMFGPEQCKYAKEGYIVYGDPGLADEDRLSSENGVYWHKNFESILEWIYEINIPFYVQGSTQIGFEGKAPYYKQIKDFGKLQPRKWEDSQKYVPQLCREPEEVSADTGIELEHSDSPRFLGIREVVVFGFAIKNIQIDEYYDESGVLQKGPSDFIIDVDTLKHEPVRLSAGEDYVLVKNKETGKYRIVFSQNISPNYIDKFGKLGTKVRLSRVSIFGQKPGSPPTCVEGDTGDYFSLLNCNGYLRDGTTAANNTTVYDGNNGIMIFTTGEGTTGVGLQHGIGKIFVVYDWETPCMHITSLENDITHTNLSRVAVNIYPIIEKDVPRSIAFCNKGATTILDPKQVIPDKSYATVENLPESAYQRALDSMENADVRVTLPFVDDDGELSRIASKIYALQNQVVETTTYTCSPTAVPVLGTLIDGKTINSIDYSYQDTSQYLISINAGPVWQGFGGWDQSIYQNQTERVQVDGKVMSVHSSNTKCTVFIDRIGNLECINGASDVLESGDIVKVTLYNNPVSV